VQNALRTVRCGAALQSIPAGAGVVQERFASREMALPCRDHSPTDERLGDRGIQLVRDGEGVFDSSNDRTMRIPLDA